MRRPAARHAAFAALLACATLLAIAGCASHGELRAHAARVTGVAPAADSVTVGLWRFDENGGTRASDAGPFRLDGVAGIDTRTDFGRYRSARVFQRTNDSFVYVPHNPVLDLAAGTTVEAWVWINTPATYELQVIAARWTPAPNAQSWLLGVTGQSLGTPLVGADSPGWFKTMIGLAPQQRLVFGFQPAQAGGFQGYFSTSDLPLQHWVHVAATLDGRSVRLFVDGRQDAQFAINGTIRASDAPLMVGNVFDPRYLTSFGGDLRVDPAANVTTYYPFDGYVDELRISSAARSTFETAPRP